MSKVQHHDPSPQSILGSRFVHMPDVPPLHIVGAQGCELHLAGGGRLLDASGGPMVVNLGYGRPEIAEALRKAAESPGYVMPFFSCPARLSLLDRLRSFLPKTHGRVFLTSGGSEAVESAFKVARAVHIARGEPQRVHIIGRQLSYHGSTAATLAAGDARVFRGMQLGGNGQVPKLPLPRAHWTALGRPQRRAPSVYAAQLEARIQSLGPERVSAFVFEPIGAAASSVTIPPPGYYEALAEVCERHGVLMIADEVVTGFGRTGTRFGYQHWSFTPDILAVAKGLSSGFAPLGGIAVRETLLEEIEAAGVDPGTRFTFSGHPLACAVGDAVLGVIEKENLVERARGREADIEQRLAPLREIGIVRDIRGRGMLWSISLGEDGRHFPQADQMRQALLMQLFMRGVLAWPGYACDAQGEGDSIIIAPPFVATDAVFDRIADALRGSLEALADLVARKRMRAAG